jgi:hypothetical protein
MASAKAPQTRLGVCVGAKGLEPATSGVTGHFSERYMGDDPFVMALVTSVFGRERACPRWLHRLIPRVCCPIAARQGLFLRSDSWLRIDEP